MDSANQAATPVPEPEEKPGNCTMIVVTDSAAAVLQGDAIKQALLRTFGHRSPYYLLSAPSLALLCKDGEQAELVADDIMTAVRLHGVDRLLVASMRPPPDEIVRSLRAARPALAARVRIKECPLPRPRRLEDPETLVIACRDWRLQDGHGFRAAVASAFGVESPAFMGTSGGAKELARESARKDMVLAQIPRYAARGLRRVVLLSHTDCGMYGGDRSFESPAAQRAALERDLAPATAAIAAAFPALRVDAGIVWCDEGGVQEITPVGRAARAAVSAARLR